MFCRPATRCVVLFALMAFLIEGGATVLAQGKSSSFYSTYDVPELAKNSKYKGIEFADSRMGNEMSIITEPKEGYRHPMESVANKSQSNSYGFRILTTGDDVFKVSDFLDWLAQETIKQIESGKGKVGKQYHKVGRRFIIEYEQEEFTGRVEVYADVRGKELDLEVELVEGSKNYSPGGFSNQKTFALWAAIHANDSLFQEGVPKELMIHFTLVNGGAESIDPKVGSWRLVINGGELDDSGFIFGTGPRDARWKALPPGENLRFSYRLEKYFKGLGVYRVSWRGEGFESMPIEFCVLPGKKRE